MGRTPNKKAPPAPAAPMQAAGAAKATKDGKAAQLKIANKCLEWLPDKELQAAAGPDWGKIPENIVCATLLWRYLATFLSEVYEIDSGKRNAGEHKKNIKATWSNLFHEASLRFNSADSPDTSKARAAPPALPAVLPCP